MGASGLCVPDLTFRHKETKRAVALELFHAWHAGALARRLGELRSRPDAGLLLGVDRALAKGEEREALEAHPQVVLFNGFPSARRLLDRLGRLEGPGPRVPEQAPWRVRCRCCRPGRDGSSTPRR